MAGREVTFTADDFGLSIAVNEAVEDAHRRGVLDAASLMVAGPAAEDAVARAKLLPDLQVGLHIVAVEGPCVLPYAELRAIAGPDGRLPPQQVELAFRYAMSRQAREQLAREIRAQFAAFAATGLTLGHADAHKHMHLHPVVGTTVIGTGREFGLTRLRVPAEPPAVMRACGERPTFGDRALHAWTGWLRTAARRAGLQTTDHCFGLRWSGHVTAERLTLLARHLPPGSSEIYLHPATGRAPELARWMLGYEHEAEYRALLDPEVARAFGRAARIGATRAATAS
ncbi:MAG TPA: hopanoid biosynthesis-associated protein HpnK [Acidisphaera sp.]|nr:hopanoid biosynthesis-associated protein HpnK [Acidisphaera sp.]